MSKGVEIGPMEKSSFVKPYSIAYTLDGKKMRWDAVQSHPAVACVLVHRDTKSMLLVRQFRPAVRGEDGMGGPPCAGGGLDEDRTVHPVLDQVAHP